MSYGVAAALQAAVFQHLSADSALAALVGTAIYDAVPTGTLPSLYVMLGPEEARDRSDATGSGAWHKLTVAVVTDGAGFHQAKQVAATISDALHGAALTLTRGRLVDLSFERARAKLEGTGEARRIDMTFRARVEDTV